MSFLYFSATRHTSLLGFPLVNPPGGIPLHRIERRYKPEKTMNPYKIYTHAQKPRKRPTMQAGYNGTINRTTHAHERHKPGTCSPRASILDYILRLPGECTHKKKAPAYNRGYNINCSCLTIQPSQPVEKVIYK